MWIRSSSNKVGVGACSLEKATRTDSSANIGAAQSESESSRREGTLLVRDFASEQPESAVESQTAGGVAQATSPAVWDGARDASGGPCAGLGRPSAPPGTGHELQRERVRRKPQLLEPVPKQLQDWSKTLLLLNLRCLNWTTLFTTAACNPRFEKFGPPVLFQLRYGGASHEAFTAFLDVAGMQKKSRWGSHSGPRRYEKAARISHLIQAASTQGLRWPEVYPYRLA